MQLEYEVSRRSSSSASSSESLCVCPAVLACATHLRGWAYFLRSQPSEAMYVVVAHSLSLSLTLSFM